MYSRLPLDAASDYIRVKEALLKRFHLTQERFRQKFRTCVPKSGEGAPQFSVRIENYLVR